MPEKTFDKAELLKFFDENGHEAIVGRLVVIYPAKDLYSDTTTERYPIAAETQAMYCERYGFAVVKQQVRCEKLHLLPKDHPLRTEKPLHFRQSGGDSSAQLMRWAAQLADQWRMWVEWAAPTLPLDFTRREVPAESETDPEETMPTSAQNSDADDDDTTPTGVSVDDPFAGDDE